eukprot:TRINITY_DN11203_c0_g1_i1.p1 TRINITY_DN11203_c0_g1~~TRINITY_DN11203_c0_g1_i1.p1  ORF type:complete len:792 (-),score=214.80 TRINITY_DN11203_c0_g1_i1:59-2434(-)
MMDLHFNKSGVYVVLYLIVIGLYTTSSHDVQEVQSESLGTETLDETDGEFGANVNEEVDSVNGAPVSVIPVDSESELDLGVDVEGDSGISVDDNDEVIADNSLVVPDRFLKGENSEVDMSVEDDGSVVVDIKMKNDDVEVEVVDSDNYKSVDISDSIEKSKEYFVEDNNHNDEIIHPPNDFEKVEKYDLAELTKLKSDLQKHKEDLNGTNWRTAFQGLITISKSTYEWYSSQACLIIGDFYAGLIALPPKGPYPKVDLNKAFHYYKKAAETGGYADAHFMLGFLYDNHPKALKKKENLLPARSLVHYNIALDQGSERALMTLGYKYFYGHRVHRNCNFAAEYFKAATFDQVFSTSARPEIKLSTEYVRLMEDGDSKVNKLEEEMEIINYYQYTADMGEPNAQVAMGIIYLNGIHSVPQDYSKAFYYFEKAVENDETHGDAISGLAYMYENGYSVEQDHEKAIELYKKAALLNNGLALNQLGEYYKRGEKPFIYKNPKKAYEYFEQGKAAKHPFAALNMGRMTYNGEGVKANEIAANQYFQMAAQMGNLRALYNLGQMSYAGRGTGKSCNTAVRLYKKIADKKYLKEMTMEAYRYYIDGHYERALIIYELAGAMGNELSVSNAGWMYENGIGIDLYGSHKLSEEEIKAKSKNLYRLAAELDSANAHLKMGDFVFEEGDYNFAAEYYKIANARKDAEATFNLGYMHHFGIGLEKDYHLAKRYYDSAMEMDPNAYYPSLLALGSLIVESNWENLLEDSTILGWEWDNFLLGLLSVILVVSLVIRHFLTLQQRNV